MTKVIVNGRVVDMGAAVALMDEEIRDMLHEEMAPCGAQEFVATYCEAHRVKYGTEFEVS